MKEVRDMDVRVIAYPCAGAWTVECSEHGLLGVVADADVDLFLASHMADHGAAVLA